MAGRLRTATQLVHTMTAAEPASGDHSLYIKYCMMVAIAAVPFGVREISDLLIARVKQACQTTASRERARADNAASTSADVHWLLRDGSGAENMDVHWRFTEGEPVKIRLVNPMSGAHPMQHPIHFHGQRFVVTAIDGKPVELRAWKDTVLVPGGSTIDIVLDPSNPGEWMAHCHIAEHLTSGMMIGFTVTPKP